MLIEYGYNSGPEPETWQMCGGLVAEADRAPRVLHHVVDAGAKNSLDSCRLILGAL